MSAHQLPRLERAEHTHASQYLTAENRVIMSAPHWGLTRDLPQTEPSPCILLLFKKEERGFWGAPPVPRQRTVAPSGLPDDSRLNITLISATRYQLVGVEVYRHVVDQGDDVVRPGLVQRRLASLAGVSPRPSMRTIVSHGRAPLEGLSSAAGSGPGAGPSSCVPSFTAPDRGIGVTARALCHRPSLLSRPGRNRSAPGFFVLRARPM